jgi:hypothetical protein
MHLYFATSQIPELANLSYAQRRLVKEQCFFWLFRRVSYRLGSLAIIVGSILFASYAADTLKWGVWKSAILAGASVLMCGYLYDLICIAHWRSEVARFIQLHAGEIQTAA